MKKPFINFLIGAFIFIVTFLATTTSFMSIQDSFMWKIGLTKSAGLLITYVVIFIVGVLNLRFFHERLGFRGVSMVMVSVFVVLIVLNSIGPSMEFTLKTLPYYPIWLLAFVAAILHYRRKHKKIRLPILLALIPLIMSFGIYDAWSNWFSYGNLTGEVSEQKIIPFEFTNDNSETVNNESLKDKIILLNFISIGCKPCWIKFPDFQRIYNKYQSNPMVETYTVAHLSTPDIVLNSIEEQGYSFPVVQGSDVVMGSFDLRFYPTVILLDKNGKICFKGELEAAESKLESLLNPNTKE